MVSKVNCIVHTCIVIFYCISIMFSSLVDYLHTHLLEEYLTYLTQGSDMKITLPQISDSRYKDTDEEMLYLHTGKILTAFTVSEYTPPGL